jgi:hypothetical protein
MWLRNLPITDVPEGERRRTHDLADVASILGPRAGSPGRAYHRALTYLQTANVVRRHAATNK